MNTSQIKERHIKLKYTPIHQKKEVSVAAWTCFGAAFALYIFSLTGLPFSSILQFIMTAFLCAGAYILIRYRFTTVTYEVRKRSGHSSASYGDDINGLPASMVDLAVHRAQGKRENLEFIMSLDRLTDVIKVEKDTAEKLRTKYSGIKCYYYTVDMIKRERIALVFDDDGDKYCLIIERDENFTAYLEETCRRNSEKDL